jgi:hypothetical protein
MPEKNLALKFQKLILNCDKTEGLLLEGRRNNVYKYKVYTSTQNTQGHESGTTYSTESSRNRKERRKGHHVTSKIKEQ